MGEDEDGRYVKGPLVLHAELQPALKYDNDANDFNGLFDIRYKMPDFINANGLRPNILFTISFEEAK